MVRGKCVNCPDKLFLYGITVPLSFNSYKCIYRQMDCDLSICTIQGNMKLSKPCISQQEYIEINTQKVLFTQKTMCTHMTLDNELSRKQSGEVTNISLLCSVNFQSTSISSAKSTTASDGLKFHIRSRCSLWKQVSLLKMNFQTPL